MEQITLYTTLGTVAWNTGLVVIAGELTRRWMNGQEKKQEDNRLAVKDAANRLAADLKATVSEHRQEIKDAHAYLSDHLKGIYEQLRIANGRTTKNENSIVAVAGIVGKIEALCEEKHKQR